MPMTKATAGAFALGLTCGLAAPALFLAPAGAREPSPRPSPVSAELERLYNEDQADRSPADGKPIDWNVVGPRDAAREACDG